MTTEDAEHLNDYRDLSARLVYMARLLTEAQSEIASLLAVSEAGAAELEEGFVAFETFSNLVYDKGPVQEPLSVQ